jgi:hypothetical protein
VKKVSKLTHDQFNKLFPQRAGKNRAQNLNFHDYSYGNGSIYNTGDLLDDGLINASRILKTINLLEGNLSNKQDLNNSSNAYQYAIGNRNRHMEINNSMSNINEGVEFSTGRQDEEEGINNTQLEAKLETSKGSPSEINFKPSKVHNQLVKRKEKTVWKKVVKFMRK